MHPVQGLRQTSSQSQQHTRSGVDNRIALGLFRSCHNQPELINKALRRVVGVSFEASRNQRNVAL